MMNIIGAIVLIALVVWGIRRATNNKKIADENKNKAADFWTENAKKEGVEQTRSGLQYLVLEEGNGKSPAATDMVKVHYHGTLLDGSVFDSSVDRGQPISFGLNQVIPGWTEGLQLMKEGGKTRLFIPSELAYGDRAAGTIPPGSLLIFDVELIEVH
ncbi:FKBP-type peptidyl-prolyl cis-trans isomerase [Bacterioplanoides sp.]|uniref:FKBP-type peptidyl-prolyl cis-trans isomerase n=1 Tax=Bacterioplanoides sp. TaxID=2066072 RepID=UPI003B5A5915